MKQKLKETRKKSQSGNVLNIRVDLDSRKFEGPLREKIRTLVKEEVVRTFDTICSHCRKSNSDDTNHNSLFLVASMELTKRQKEIMELVVQKKSDRQITRILGIEINTVRNHMKSIKTRLGVHTRTDAVAEYLSSMERNREVATKKPGLAIAGESTLSSKESKHPLPVVTLMKFRLVPISQNTMNDKHKEYRLQRVPSVPKK